MRPLTVSRATRKGEEMSSEKEKKLPGISRQAEEKYLTKTLAVIRDNMENYGRDVA